MKSTWVVGAAILAMGGCHREKPAPTESAPSASAMPVDHLGPNELIEGKQILYGVPLPRGSVIERWEHETAAVSDDATIVQLTAYVRARVIGEPEVTPYHAVFDHVKLRSDPKHVLSFRITTGPGVRKGWIYIDDQPALPTGDAGSPEDRRRQAGLTPDGKIADPTHLN